MAGKPGATHPKGTAPTVGMVGKVMSPAHVMPKGMTSKSK